MYLFYAHIQAGITDSESVTELTLSSLCVKIDLVGRVLLEPRDKVLLTWGGHPDEEHSCPFLHHAHTTRTSHKLRGVTGVQDPSVR